MLPSDGGGRYAGPEHIEPRCSQTLLHYLIIFCKIYSATEGINTEFITFPCKYEHGEGGREAFRHFAQQLAWAGCVGAAPSLCEPNLQPGRILGSSGQGALQNTHPNAPLPPLGRGGLGVLWGTRRSSEDSAAPAGAVGWGSAGCPWLCRAEMLPARGFSEAAVGSRTAGAELGCKPACFWSLGPSYSLVLPETSRLTLADLRPNRSSPCCSSPHSERQQRRLSGGAHNLPEQTRVHC